jgi:aerobic-type carbon monoxide dehydrogenase small subunit (CoxS/CutS family)
MSDDATTDAGAGFPPDGTAPGDRDDAAARPGVWQPLPRAEAYDSDQTMHVSFAAQPAPGGPDPLAAPGGQLPPEWERAQWHVPAAPDDAADSGEYTLGTYTTPWQPPAPDTAGFPAGWGPPPGAAPDPAAQGTAAQDADAHGRAGTDAPWDPAAPPAGHADAAWQGSGAAPAPGWVDVPPPRDGVEYAAPAAAEAPAPYEAEAPPAPAADESPADAGAPVGAAPAGTAGTAAPAGDAAGDAAPAPAADAPAPADAPADEDPDDDEDEEDDEPPARAGDHPLVSYTLHVNGADRPVTGAWLGESLLYVLRERLGLAGAKDGCEQGECGACSVQVDGRLVASCLVPAAVTEGSEIRTVEGLSGPDGEPSDVQRALADRGAVQCGFCVPGLAMTVHDLLEGNHDPSELEARAAVSGNLCRCSGYRGVLAAVRQVVGERAERQQAPPGTVPTGQPGADPLIPPQATDSPDGGPR